ncbi:Fic family protein [Bacteriovorax stolpii]|uniref:Uncharacterized protein n=1 Tax=Bacteriovorax stolpii TaxID=960 RepID=A0A2K9NU47_BACTC|nr:Fic family protein [Bacteriovorax stolpii]AUN99017.1 hypothetical protein C0V70_13080 [Bacteriovorax stolpii]QDK40987.1 Fic family protein [Bacteriovorax stolpii]TDP55457.1 Fic family protein [Bacteriovorax stolpii]
MNIEELEESLKQPFTLKRGFGITKINHPEWQNIFFIVPPAPPKELDTKKLPYSSISKALKVLSALPHFSQMSELDKLVNYLFVRREVVQSSRLEGTWSTIDHALTPGDLADADEGKNEHQAVRSYAKILEEMIEETLKKKESVFNLKLIQEIHKQIVEHDPKSKGVPGKLRTEGEPGSVVIIGGGQRKENSLYNPAPPSEVLRTLNEVLTWLSDANLAIMGDAGGGGLSLPVRLAIAHSHFEAVHPFTDGNGRCGRALWPLQMICAGNSPLYLSGYVEEYKDSYTKALQEAQKRLNYNPLIEFLCEAIIEADLEAKKTRETIHQMPEVWNKRSGFREKSAPKRALTLLLHYPIISSAILEKELGVKRTAADNAINSLLEKKIIRYRQTENRQRLYAAEEIIQILSRPFGSEIELALEKARGLLKI